MGYSSVRDFYVKSSQQIVRTAEREERPLTAQERADVEEKLAAVKAIDEQERWVSGDLADAPESVRRRAAEQQAEAAAYAKQIADVTGSAGGGAGLAEAAIAAGFSVKSQPSVSVSGASVFGKSVTDSIDPINWNPRPPDLVGLGHDRRYLWKELPTTSVDGTSSIQDFKQTARSVTGSAKRAIDATSVKAELNTTIDLVTEEMFQFALLIDAIPAQMLMDIAALRNFLNGEMTHELNVALDAHVVAQIVAAGPTQTTAGAGIIENSRYAKKEMAATGAVATLLALDPTDAAELDLETQPGGGGDYLFPLRDSGGASPLWNLRVVDTPAMTANNPIVIAPATLGAMFVGPIRLDADTSGDNFKKNLVTLRIETTALFHVRNIASGARVLETFS